MTACTDDERREVAERLRRAWANVPDKNPVRHHMRVLYEIYAAVGLNDDGVDAIDLFDHLADLIEPPTQCPYYRSDRHYCSIHDVPAIDRDALLALADEMQGYADGAASVDGFPYVNAGFLWSYADRIREALGVER